MLISTFEKIALSKKDKIAIYGDCGEYTYTKLYNLTIRYSTVLEKAGLLERTTLAVESKSNGEYVAIYLACARLGICIIPIDTRLTEEEINSIFNESDPAGVIIFDDVGTLAKVASNKNYFLSGFSLDSVCTLKIKEEISANPFIRKGDLVIPYSSGSTGKPKGVILSNSNVFYRIINWNKAFLANEDDLYLNTLTLSNCYGMSLHVLSAILVGAKVFIMDTSAILPNRVCKIIQSEKITIFGSLPYMYEMFNRMGSEHIDFNSVRYLVSGGAPLGEKTWETFEEKFGRGINQVYGLTEIGLILFNPQNMNSGSLGKPTPNMEVKVINTAGSLCQQGESGEMVARCDSLSQRYMNNPIEQAAMFKDGWLYTKDIVKQRVNGSFEMIGRISQFINIHGNKVSPFEIEEFIKTHPEVIECAVISVDKNSKSEVKDISRGNTIEQIYAYVVKTTGSNLDENHLVKFCRKGLTSFKVPTKILFIENLPKSPMGKVVKSKLGELV